MRYIHWKGLIGLPTGDIITAGRKLTGNFSTLNRSLTGFGHPSVLLLVSVRLAGL